MAFIDFLCFIRIVNPDFEPLLDRNFAMSEASNSPGQSNLKEGKQKARLIQIVTTVIALISGLITGTYLFLSQFDAGHDSLRIDDMPQVSKTAPEPTFDSLSDETKGAVQSIIDLAWEETVVGYVRISIDEASDITSIAISDSQTFNGIACHLVIQLIVVADRLKEKCYSVSDIKAPGTKISYIIYDGVLGETFTLP